MLRLKWKALRWLLLLLGIISFTAFSLRVAQPQRCSIATFDRDRPMYITPHFQNLDLNSEEYLQHVDEVMQVLEGKSEGKVQLGYTQIVFPLALYDPTPNEWKLNTAILDQTLAEAAKFNRPFVLYVYANHFTPTPIIPLAMGLAEDKTSLMQYRDGSVPSEEYFGKKLAAFRLTTDPEEPIVFYMKQSLQAIAERVRAFDAKHPDLVIGIMLNGETHYLYEDFFGGTANFSSPRFTDYHPKEIKAFAEYLRATGSELNAQEIKALPLDRAEWGTLHISGWVHPYMPKDAIEVWVDNNKVGTATTHINRMDVFRAKKEQDTSFAEPNSGYVYQLDHTALPAGKRYVEVLLRRGEALYILGSRWVNIVREGEPLADFAGPIERAQLPAGVSGYIDVPANEVEVAYHPLAEAWMKFRAKRIQDYVEWMATPFRDAGFGKDRVFSYQLTPWLIGNWNAALFGVAPEFFQSEVMSPGLTLYGGKLLNPHVFDMLPKGQPYGLPEMHPQGDMGQAWNERMINEHYCHGATFLSPYFMLPGDLFPIRDRSEHSFMVVSENNEKWGSDQFYRALKQALSY